MIFANQVTNNPLFDQPASKAAKQAAICYNGVIHNSRRKSLLYKNKELL